jgi:hypothetical protein
MAGDYKIVTPCSLVHSNISEQADVSTFHHFYSPEDGTIKTSLLIYQTTRCHFFVDHITMLSVAPSGRADKFEGMWKGAVVAYFNVLSWHLSSTTEEIHEELRTAGIPA